ncbi:MAG TPA: hypothetical protein VFF06_23755 [Polyangia bacterium]|nr:hypothetical protein [Polyangia bacterium]
MVPHIAELRIRRDRLFREADARSRRIFEVETAERILPLFEARRPEDSRPRRALEVARAHLDGRASEDELAAASAAAHDAAAPLRDRDPVAYRVASAAGCASRLYHSPFGSDYQPSAANESCNAAYLIGAGETLDADAAEDALTVELRLQLARLEAIVANTG